MKENIVETSADEWALKHSLRPEADNCPKCGVVREANIPFSAFGCDGLMSEDHGCGENYRLRVFRSTKISDVLGVK